MTSPASPLLDELLREIEALKAEVARLRFENARLRNKQIPQHKQ